MRRCMCTLGLSAVLASLSLAFSAPALAASSAGPPQWVITSVAGPAYFKPLSQGDFFIVTATNVGGESTSGTVTIMDTIRGKAEVTAIIASQTAEGFYGEAFTKSPLNCATTAPTKVTCSYPSHVDPGDTLTFAIKLNVLATERKLENTATVSGGGASSASTSEPTTRSTPISEQPVPFGVASFFAAASTSQAGGHPNFTTSFTTNWSEVRNKVPIPPAAPHEVGVDLPPGLTGNPLAIPRCDIDSVRRRLCDEDSAVGIATVRTQGSDVFNALVYNITPYPDEPAAFAFTIDRGIGTARLDTSVVPRSNGEYAVHVTVADVNESEALLSSSVTLWGVPSLYNGPGPDTTTECNGKPCLTFGGPGAQAGLAKPFLRNPTSCAGSPEVALQMDSWQNRGVFPPVEPSPLLTPTECSLISPLFTPSLEVTPDESTQIGPNTFQAGAPAGYQIHLSVPQSASAQTRGTPDLRNATVTLPPGVVASPSAANGLEACTDAQLATLSVEPATCPRGSQIGEVEVETPLLLKPLKGQVFLGKPECSPCGPSEAAEGKMVRLFLQAQGSGVRIKLAGRTRIDQGTGQLTTVFEENPQQPFERLTLHIDGGPAAPLANPSACGTATTHSQLVPWSSTAAVPFGAEPSSSFQVGGCAARFAPSFGAGMSGSPQAGAYSPLTVMFSRTDQDQTLGGITVVTPPGLIGAVSHVKQCAEPQASQGSCGPESQIGTVTVAAGPGPNPFWITGGRAYLTGPYKGGPFGLSIVVPAVAGPFNLGEEHLRSAIYVDPHTSALTVVSDPLPTQKDGIPFQVKTVQVNVDRPQFTFNATNCDPMAIGATISSTQGAVAAVSSPYQPAGCASLPFGPSFAATTQGSTSKSNGASLDVKVGERPGDANIHKVNVSLPIALPSRLTTLQKACTETQFAVNPAGCPEGSNVGIATARSPILNSPLSGPAYLVSHSNAAFPDLDIILQGEGITIDLTGNTDIKKGITYSRFEMLPDAPVSAFELNLPQGPHSALGAFGNLCGQNLVMPTTMVGQNGAQVTQNTRIAVVGCAKPTVSVKKARVKGNAMLLTVATTQSGTVTVAGRGLKTTTKSLGAGTHVIVVPLTRAGMAGRRHHDPTKIKVSPKGSDGTAGKAQTMSVKL